MGINYHISEKSVTQPGFCQGGGRVSMTGERGFAIMSYVCAQTKLNGCYVEIFVCKEGDYRTVTWSASVRLPFAGTLV